jgi:hypothetical protein
MKIINKQVSGQIDERVRICIHKHLYNRVSDQVRHQQ